MKATFEQQGFHEPIVVLTPENKTEALLLAAWMRYDSNAFSIHVERLEDGRIERVDIRASHAE